MSVASRTAVQSLESLLNGAGGTVDLLRNQQPVPTPIRAFLPNTPTGATSSALVARTAYADSWRNKSA